ncbi:bifunctional 3'-5' exonuclease/DNA polymerase [Agromyces silvae]|uniref:bifunctional 3'-5' exonuclease/DNA polymerase n=1 Tax=Agromyces silvae TaxID=3388266 RepID=UPI00280B5DA7|nr:bifunctional 3'-5' exonuclease/DNA polymerase [Agromyces protaetiae]
MRIVIAGEGRGPVTLVDPDADAHLATTDRAGLPDVVRRYEAQRPRWIWHDTRDWAPGLLAAGVRVERCHDLRLSAAILEHSTLTERARADAPPRPAWLRRGPAEAPDGASPAAASPGPGVAAAAGAATLFDEGWGEASDDRIPPVGAPSDGAPHDHDRATDHGARLDEARDDRTPGETPDALIAEYRRQLALVEASDGAGRLRLLVAAESAGALIACELAAAGVPWRADEHDRVLVELLGPRPYGTGKPVRMLELAAEVRDALDAPRLNPDSHTDLLRALRAAGLAVDSTSRWELRELEHPAIEPLISYKKLARVLSANGWGWLEEWVVDGRFRPEYVPGGAASGRWATAGGGALQLPKQIRRALVADPGWCLVVADAAQLEPRVLAGMSHDLALAEAGRGRDLYAGLVGAGVVATRTEAKYAVLGAIYGATSGDSGRLVPRLARAYPRAMALVDRAAADGERGLRVTTLLGRSSPLPGPDWRAVQSRASQPDASPSDERRARTVARDWGRFTRNFVVQGTAAEWAVIWMAGLRRRLATIGADRPAAAPADASGPVFARVPHLVYFLHDEVIVHAPAEHADEVARAVHETAAEAGRLLFGDFPVDFPLELRAVGSYAEAG